MKAYKHKPDFHKLCQPKRKHTTSSMPHFIFLFFLASISGFLWEILIFLIKDGHFRNRGFFYGPWLPVYGAGAVFIYAMLVKLKKHPVIVFLLSAAIGSILEFFIGWLLNSFWHLRYWDYRGYCLNFHGYICLWSALGFGIAGTIWVCLAAEFLTRLWFILPARFRKSLNALLVLLFLLDCTAALILPNTGIGITFP